jgi:hypothetical protein
MADLFLREPHEDDWPAILELANRSVADVPGAGSQDEWLKNRRSTLGTGASHSHWVATNPSLVEIAGFAAIEEVPKRPGTARLFVVTTPDDRETVGVRLLGHVVETARRRCFSGVYFVEYANDAPFVEFLERQGFGQTRRLPLPEGGEAVVLERLLSQDS